MLIASTSILKRDRIREMWEALSENIQLSVRLCHPPLQSSDPDVLSSAVVSGDGYRVSADDRHPPFWRVMDLGCLPTA
jgi:hypothetical protein